MRIARAMALAGIASRRKSEEYILNGAVTVNGEVVRDLGRQVDTERDGICFRGKLLCFHSHVYYLINKPKGYTSTASDPHAEKSVYELLPRKFVKATRQTGGNRVRVFPVGRLDRDSTGILIFTNDGELANRILHPRYEVEKTYQVRLDRAFDMRDKAHLLRGVRLEDGVATAKRVTVLTRRTMRIILSEGKKREVRRMFEAIGYEVVDLCRVAVGPVLLGHLPLGTGRHLTRTEIEGLRRMTHLK